jgi:alkanesulfonate monooxygenase SsuD/methylene tetrahydromethanopterin reductase-like flavin-dependent oxidoreductase (luciferase family)
MTKFGIVVPQHDITADEMLGAVHLAESSNLDSIWFADHLQGRPHPGYLGGIAAPGAKGQGRGELLLPPNPPPRPILEGWSSLSAAAATTKRITIGMLAIRAGLRTPRLLATMAATANAIAPGRITICLGIGDQTIHQEQTAYGIPFQPKPKRLNELTESVKTIKKETSEVRIWIGGVSNELIEAATHIDGWNAWAPPEEFAQHVSTYRELGGSGEISWAGSHPGPETINSLITAGANHLIIATGSKNYAQRINQLSTH